MLNFVASRRNRDCEGTTRRDFMRVGSLGLGSFALPDLLRARAEAAAAGQSTSDTSVIWLWLGGGPMFKPMAIAILFGLMFATALTLGVVPILYSLFFGVSFRDAREEPAR